MIGAESSGKSTLAAALAAELGGVVVAEALRRFVDANGRPPRRDEQSAVLRAQIDAEHRALAAGARWVVSDAGALMTAVYSVQYFGDRSLLPRAAAHHRSAYCATLWCDIDVPWTPDPGQRDGPDLRRATHRLVAEVLAEYGIAAQRISGDLPARLHRARQVLAPDG